MNKFQKNGKTITKIVTVICVVIYLFVTFGGPKTFLLNVRHWVFGPHTGDIVLDEHGFPTGKIADGIKKIPVKHFQIDNSGSWIRVATHSTNGLRMHFEILTENVYWQVRARSNIFDCYPRGRKTSLDLPPCDNVDFRVDYSRHPYNPEKPVKAIMYVEYIDPKEQN